VISLAGVQSRCHGPLPLNLLHEAHTRPSHGGRRGGTGVLPKSQRGKVRRGHVRLGVPGDAGYTRKLSRAPEQEHATFFCVLFSNRTGSTGIIAVDRIASAS
jgi:hypothetical protein